MFFVDILSSKKLKTHDFCNLEQNIDYFVDFTESGRVATLTTAKRVKLRERVVLLFQQQPVTYLVEDLKSYWNDDLQTFLLRRIE